MNINPGDTFYAKITETGNEFALLGCEAVRAYEIDSLFAQSIPEGFDEGKLEKLNVARRCLHNVQLQGGKDFWGKFDYLSAINVYELELTINGMFNIDFNSISGSWISLTVTEEGGFQAKFRDVDTEEIYRCWCNCVQFVAPDFADSLDKVFELPSPDEESAGTLTMYNHILQSMIILDVGQGLCVAIKDENDKVCGLFDMGGNLSYAQSSGVRFFLCTQLYQFPDIGTYMPVVLSHWHTDHVNMIPWISAFSYKIHWYVSAYGQPSTGRIYLAMRNSSSANITVVSPATSQLVNKNGDYWWSVCGTNRADSKHAHDHGLYSEIVIAEGGKALLCGDTSYDLIKNSPYLTGYSYDILQVCHHGGTYWGNQNSGARTNIPAPANQLYSVGVVSYGSFNRYNHPNQGVMIDHGNAGWQRRHDTAITGAFCSHVDSLPGESAIVLKSPINFSEDNHQSGLRIKETQDDGSFYDYVTKLFGSPEADNDVFKSILVDAASAVSSSEEVLGINRYFIHIPVKADGNTLRITSKLSAKLDEIVVCYNDAKDYYGYDFQGTLAFDREHPSFDIRYSSSGYITAELDTNNTALRISSLLDIVELFEISDIREMLPKELSEFNNFELNELKIEIKPGFSGLKSFCLGLIYSQSWHLPGFEGLCGIGSPKLQFTSIFESPNIYIIELSGNVKISSFNVELSGMWKSNSDGLVFHGTLIDEKVDIPAFFDNVLSFMGFQNPQLPFPHIKLTSACFNFDTSNSALDLNIGIVYDRVKQTNNQDESILNKLFEISSYIDIHSTVSNDGKRAFSGHFEGWLHIKEQIFTVVYEFGESAGNEVTASWNSEDGGLPLLDIIAFLGVKNAEEVLNPLNIVCKSVSMQFDIDKKDMTLSVDSNYGDLTCRLREDESDGLVYMVRLAFKDSLTLSGLPLINEIVNVSDTGLSNLSLTISNGKWDTIKSGITLDGNAFHKDMTMPFEWCSDDTPGNSAQNNLLAASANIPVNWSIGAVNLRSIIPGYQDGQIQFGVDISFHLGMLEVSFENLKLTYGITDQKVGMGLDGLALSAESSSVDLEGSLICTADNTYTGTLRVKCAKWDLQAAASYIAGENNSLFAFGMLRGTLGGPPCFMLTGIGAGLGYSRELSVPEIENLNDFALVGLAMGKRDVSDIVEKVDEEFKPARGSKWLAAGITANSFRMIDILLLLTAQLDKNPVFHLIGCADVSVPFGVETPVAYAGLLVKITVDPSSGYVPVDGILSNDSYVLSRDCHLSGGFAFYTWYGGEHAGDFVISLGGYRSTYQKPEHYPSPQRLQLNWQLSENLSAEGSLYFALTPSCVMAGGDLNMDFAWKCVRANFHAYVDILMCWKPYSYDFSVGISLKVQAKLKIFKVKLELGCDLAIWGPEFSGIAKIHLWVISFSIAFGNGSRGTKVISVDDFRRSFLMVGEEKTDVLSADQSFCGPTIHFVGGVIEERKKGETVIKTVSGEKLEIQVESIVPAVEVRFNEESVVSGGDAVCLRPCSDDDSTVSVSPTLFVKLGRLDGTAMEAQWKLAPVSGNLPAALWAEKSYKVETIEHTTGLTIRLQNRKYFRRLVYTETNREEGRECSVSSPVAIKAKEYDQGKAYEQINGVKNLSDKIRGLFPEFPADSINMDEFSDSSKIFNEVPILQNIGGQA